MAEPAAGRGGNLLALALIQAFRMGAGMLVNVMVMRSAGVEGFGVFGYVTTLVGLASFGTTMGMDRLLKREMARAPDGAGRWVGTGLAASALMSVATAVGIVLWTWAVDGRALVVGAAGFAAAGLALQALASILTSYFHAIQRMGLGTRPSLGGRLVLVAATAAFLAYGLDVRAVFAAQVLDGLVTVVLVAAVFRGLPDSPALTSSRGDVERLLRDAIPFGLNGLFGSIYLTSAVVLLAWFHPDAEVGVYRGAVMLVALFPIVAETFSNGIFPRMARHLGHPEAARDELEFAMRVLLAISVPAAVGGILTAEPLMVFLGGPEFAASALPFIIMAPILPLRFLNNGTSMTLTALDRQDDRTRGVFYAAVLSVVANLVVLPRYGAIGAAATTLGVEVFLTVWVQWRVAQVIPRLRLGGALLRVGAPALGMAAVLVLLPPMHVLGQIAIGGAVYLVAARLTGAWQPADLRALRRI